MLETWICGKCATHWKEFLNAAESPVQQCTFNILGLPITNSTRKKEFINTNPPEKRVSLCKSEQELKQMKPESKQVTMLSNIDCYRIRPKKLETWCLADYVAKTDVDYTKHGTSKAANYKDEENDMLDPEQLEVHEEEESYEEADGFPYTLCSGHLLRLRTWNKVIRFCRYNPKKDPDNFFHECLMLYVPWRQEDKIKKPYETYEVAFTAHQDLIMKNMNTYMNHLHLRLTLLLRNSLGYSRTMKPLTLMQIPQMIKNPVHPITCLFWHQMWMIHVFR